MLFLCFVVSFVVAELAKAKDPVVPDVPTPDVPDAPITPVVDAKCKKYSALASDIASAIGIFSARTDIQDTERIAATETLSSINYILCSTCPEIDLCKINSAKNQFVLRLPCKPTECICNECKPTECVCNECKPTECNCNECACTEFTVESAMLYLQRNDPDVLRVVDIIKYVLLGEDVATPDAPAHGAN